MCYRGVSRFLLALAVMLLLAVGLSLWLGGPRAGRGPGTAARPGERPDELVGQVVDDQGPVVGARVRLKGHADFTLTDANGVFRLRRPAFPAQVTAAKEGRFIAGSPSDTTPLVIRLRRLPAEDNEDYAWVNPDPRPAGKHNCGQCHEEIHREWAASGHARSATNRRFLNLYDGSDWQGRKDVGWSLLGEYPVGSGVCGSCHAPTLPEDLDIHFDIRKATGVAARGVHCDYCHKIEEVGPGEIGLTHGRFNLMLRRPAAGQLAFGPLDDVDRGEDAWSPLYKDSRYCASCHEGVVFGVHVYGTYSEWQQSPAAKQGRQCQTCHMAPNGRMTNLAPGRGGIERDPRTLANHRFFAGSQAEMLRRCLTVTSTAIHDNGAVRVGVELLADDVGHRVPTGFIDRNLVLVVEGLDVKGQPVPPRAGPVLPKVAGPGVAGLPGKLYARLLQDASGRTLVPFWHAEADPADTRLHPGQADRVEVTFPTAVRKVRIRLLHRRFWPEVAAVKAWPSDETIVKDELVPIPPSP